MYLSYVAWRRERLLGTAGKPDLRTAYISMGAFSLASFLFFAFTPLPRAYYPEYLFHRPEEFVPALFFALTLNGYLKKGAWRTSMLEHWIVLSLVVNFVGQAVFMSFSGQLFDFEFDATHLLKKVSYICVLVGLCFNLFAPKKDQSSELQETGSKFIPSARSLSITPKIAIFTTSLIVATLAIIGMVTYLSLFSKFQESEFSISANNVRNAGLVFEEKLNSIRNDVFYLSETPPIQGIIRASNNQGIDPLDQSNYQQWRHRLMQLFKHKRVATS